MGSTAMSGLGLYTQDMLRGAVLTLELTAGGTVVSLLAGAVAAVGRMYGPKPLRALIVSYVELVRGLPAILQLFVLYFGLTQFGIDLSSLTAAFIWMCFYGTGYAIEIFRAGLSAIPEGQHEAASALGFGPITSFRRVIVPQAFTLMLPPLTNFVVLELKNTTLVYCIGVHEIMFQARLGAGNSGNPLGVYLVAAGIYVVVNVALGRAGAFLEHRAAAAH